MWVLQITFPASIQKPLLVVLFLLPHAESLRALFFSLPSCASFISVPFFAALHSPKHMVDCQVSHGSSPPPRFLQNKVVDVDNLKVKLQVRIRSFPPDASARRLNHVIPCGLCIDLNAFLDDVESIINRKVILQITADLKMLLHSPACHCLYCQSTHSI